MSERKGDHLGLAKKVQVYTNSKIQNLTFEPMMCGLKQVQDTDLSLSFLNKKMKAPVWISSMTGGTSKAGHINKNLAMACSEFGLGMGLGSCRVLLEDEKNFNDFNLRPVIGDDQPFYANFGIAQVEEYLKNKKIDEVISLVETLKCDGLIVHVNPLQEWYQPEGDIYQHSPLETIKELLASTKISIIVKEVGQGFGPQSMTALLKLPLAAIDFAAFGGTNFTLLEMMRAQHLDSESSMSMAHVGHSAEEMVASANHLLNVLGDDVNCRQFIISGGVKSFLHGYQLVESLKANAVYGQAKSFLEHATGDYEVLQKYTKSQIDGLKLAKCFIDIAE